MEAMAVRKISTPILAMYFQVLQVCKFSFYHQLIKWQKKLSMIKMFKLFVSDHRESESV